MLASSSLAPTYRTIGITARSDVSRKADIVTKVARQVQSLGIQVLLDVQRCKSVRLTGCKPLKRMRGVDAFIVIGGDGTLLRAIRELEDFDIPILSINKGTVGFLTELDHDEVESVLPELLTTDNGIIDERSLLTIEALRGKETLWSGHVLNEAVISQGAISRLIELDTTINGEELTTFHADGLIIATPTGSTAYSLSAGGPIVHPQLEATILTPINPHSFSQKPIVVPSGQDISITILTKQNKFADVQVSLTLDGQTYITLHHRDLVRVRSGHQKVRFVRRKEETFFNTLRSKLKWGDAPPDKEME